MLALARRMPVPALLLAVIVALTGAAAARAETYGRSVAGTPLRVERRGDPGAAVRVLVVGSIHGNETAGHAVVRRLRRLAPPAGVQLWLVRTANPDGVRAGTRQNGRGVDLNRNFPFRWRGGRRPFDTYFPGSARASEPETRALRDLIARVRPDLTVHYHQHMRLVVLPRGADRRPVRAYARRVGLPARTLPRYRGTVASWQNHRFRGSTAFVVELPAGRLPARQVDRHARAVLAAAAPSRTPASVRPPVHRCVGRRSIPPPGHRVETAAMERADLVALASPPCHECGESVQRVEMRWQLDEDRSWRPGPSFMVCGDGHRVLVQPLH